MQCEIQFWLQCVPDIAQKYKYVSYRGSLPKCHFTPINSLLKTNFIWGNSSKSIDSHEFSHTSRAANSSEICSNIFSLS